ncbi:ATP-binding cassette subfamily B protein [Paenibacillus cellulosilyticus]|uniref:ATP-binding cassette subfamily B protein n=1 Tax=Paenibacillus cellulosilyticus TaxID=375489 RepID=A0A2V2Z1C5_9BACL|nr:ABC transporter ATP-binding protein [Paenibacillus cellulosilyticus]PWW08657.1 ATP-binding cassette subfamily B protein [Paenibacillus cellulosilyticus]QKS48221.1 ABC transporter ATP-binding protein [Paenibacillus cellulosilyticus]
MANSNPSNPNASTSKAPTNFDQMGFRPGGGPNHAGVPKVRSKNASGTMRRIWGYLKQQRQALVWVILCTVLTSVFALLGPYLIGRMIDDYIMPKQFDGFVRMGMILLGVYLFSALFTWIQQYMASSLSQNTVRDMREDLFNQYQRLPIQFFDQKTHGELMSRTTNDISNVSNTLNQTVVQLISSVLMLVGSLVMMLSLSIWMTLITMLTIPLIAFITKRISKHMRHFFSEQQKQLGEVNGFVQENISGLKVVKVFGREEKAVEQFREINERLRAIGVKAQSLSGSMGPMMNTMRNISFLVIAVFGAIFAYHDMITIGVIVSFLNYSNQFSQPINQLANQYNMFQSAIAGAERVFEVLDLKPEVTDDAPQSQQALIHGEVVFEDVCFGYKPEVDVLKGLSLHASPGQMIALVGPTGAGKTTVINLLTRFYDIRSGRILIDGEDIQQLDKQALRQQIGLVLQDAYVFSGTIRDNIRYGRLNATDQEVEEAARLANADTFIRKLPRGYDTPLNAEGSNLSQGQRQLLTIARAVLANPCILILDEATSSVDTRTELHIQEAMKTLMKGRTSFVIAHRLSTIQEADAILVIQDGQITEQGTHDQLIARNGFYNHMYQNQFASSV